MKIKVNVLKTSTLALAAMASTSALAANPTIQGKIEEVLDMAKIESGQIVQKERMVNLPSCMTELCGSYKTLMKQKNISFIYDFSNVKNKFVVANVNSLRQILGNILSNA